MVTTSDMEAAGGSGEVATSNAMDLLSPTPKKAKKRRRKKRRKKRRIMTMMKSPNMATMTTADLSPCDRLEPLWKQTQKSPKATMPVYGRAASSSTMTMPVYGPTSRLVPNEASVVRRRAVLGVATVMMMPV
jgi:hypothetical protein